MEFTSQIALEQLYSKYQLMDCIKGEFIAAGFPNELARLEIPVDFGIELLAQIALHKRAPIYTLVGLLRKHFLAEDNPSQACADMILKAAQEDFVDWNDLSQSVIVKFILSEDVQEKLNQFQYPLPMIEEPSTVSNNKQTGYRTIKGSLILKNNHHNEDICLDHINRMNAVPLSLNADVVAFVQNNWKNLNKAKEGEKVEDYRKRVRAFEKYDESSRDVLQALMAAGNRFWLTHKYDKRGRSYCQGYHATYQGNDWNKAVIEFADAEPVKAA